MQGAEHRRLVRLLATTRLVPLYAVLELGGRRVAWFKLK